MSKQFWRWLIFLVPVQAFLQWFATLLVVPIYMLTRFLSKRYERSAAWKDVGTAIQVVEGLDTKPMTPEELVARGKEMWVEQEKHLVKDFDNLKAWVQSIEYPNGKPENGHSTGHACYLSGLGAAAGVSLGSTSNLGAGLSKYIVKGTMVRNGLTPEIHGYHNDFSQDMLAAWLIGLMQADHYDKGHGSAFLVRHEFTKFADEYIRNGYCVKDIVNGELSSRCRHTPGANWNKWSKDKHKKYLNWHLTVGVGATIALATMACAYKVSGKKKYLFHYWFLKYGCGYGIWKWFPHAYLWREAAPWEWMRFDHSSAAPGRLATRNRYYNEILALHAAIAHWMAFPKKKNITWVRKLRELSASHYVPGLHDAALYMMDNEYEIPETTLKQLSANSTSEEDVPEYFWIDGPFFGAVMNNKWREGTRIQGNVAFMITAALIKRGLERRSKM